MNIQVALKSVGIGLLVMVSGSMGWSQGNAGLPEFFGFYALDRGRNVAIYEGKGSEGAKSAEADEYSIQQNSKFRDTMPQVSTSARFLLFYSNSGELAQSMWLYRLPFVRQIIETLPPDAFNPPTRHVIDSPNVSLLARIPELAFTLLAKPVPNQPQMVELVPSQGLAPGLYVIGYGIPGQSGWAATFAVTSSSEEEHPYCMDLILPGGPRGLFERANSELNTWAPLLASYRYAKCTSETLNRGNHEAGSPEEGTRNQASNQQVSPTGQLPSPELLTPADNSIFHNFPRTTTLTWSAVSGASSYGIEVDFSDPPGWSQSILKSGIKSTDFTFTFVGKQRGRWRVWAIDAGGKECAKSPWREFEYTI